MAVVAFVALTAATSSVSKARGSAPAISHGASPALQTYTGSQEYEELLGENDSSSYPFNTYGVEGKVPNAVGGVGVLGYGQGAESYGVYGVTFGANGIGVYGAGDGATPAPGATPSSTQQSTGVVGTSMSGPGTYGDTGFPNISDDIANPVGGVEGVDTQGTHENNGVLGITTGGGYGVEGTSGNGAFGGVFGYGTSGVGVFGSSSADNGVYGYSSSSDGVYGSSTADNGVHGDSPSTGTGTAGTSQLGFGIYGLNSAAPAAVPSDAPSKYAGVFGQSGTSAGGGPGVYGVDVHNTGTAAAYGSTTYNRYAGVYGFGNDGAGVLGYSFSDFGVLAINNSSTYPALYVQSFSTASHNIIAAAVSTNLSSANVFSVDTSGDIYAGGSVSASSFVTRSANTAANMATYLPQQSEATMEDLGSAQLVGGTAAVALASDFRKTIDNRSSYMVFLTPYGDNHGLYIASRSPAGFVVKEAMGGRSTLAFDYRIVARPFGERHARLPQLAPLSKRDAGAQTRSSYDGSAPAPKRRDLTIPAKLQQHDAAIKRAEALHISPRPLVERPNLAAERLRR